MTSRGVNQGKNGDGEGCPTFCNFSIMQLWIDQLFNQNYSMYCNFPFFSPCYQHDLLFPSGQEGRKENYSTCCNFD